MSGELLQRFKVTIMIGNLRRTQLHAEHDFFRNVAADGRDLDSLRKRCIDTAHSNILIEHVGGWSRMKALVSKDRCLATHVLVNKVNCWSSVETHATVAYMSWPSRTLRVWLMLPFNVANRGRSAAVDRAMQVLKSARMLKRRVVEAMLPDERVHVERWLLLPKSFSSIRRGGDDVEAGT